MSIEEMVPGNLKAAMKEVGAGSRDLWMVPVEDIHVIEGFNVRTRDDEYIATVREYADSMKEVGFYQHKPLTGYISKQDGKNVIMLTDGHTRLEAAKLAISEGAEIKLLPFVAKPSGTSAEDLVADLVTSNNGRPLKPIEIAAVVKRLAAFDLKAAAIARKLNISGNYVSRLLSLASAPPEIRRMVETGVVSATLAMDTLQKSPETALAVLKQGAATVKAEGKAKVTKASVGAKPVTMTGVYLETQDDDAESDYVTLLVRVKRPKWEIETSQEMKLSYKQ